MDDSTAPLKACVECGDVWPADERHFHHRDGSRDGLTHGCKPCHGRTTPKHRELWKARMLCAPGLWVCGVCWETKPHSPEFFVRNSRMASGLTGTCRECNNKQRNRRRANDPDRVKRDRQRFYRKNKEKYAAWGAAYYGRSKGAEGTHTRDEVWQMYEDQGGLCAYCEAPLFGTFDLDHMMPLVRGGRDDWTNLAATCPACNRSKGRRSAEEFFSLREAVSV